ncbi:berberine bridge enzyme-like 18 [Heracleum sosnowskyi]|uniref:Berberine bridge enzyme-like 18 n=1 Tax=Heracleum sosnowskyi TaxID=360622 RepID=A0AAD8JK31_9APIA|nr:berberine bridge enzyme-like 18 [Heracleum sosnowskyi]
MKAPTNSSPLLFLFIFCLATVVVSSSSEWLDAPNPNGFITCLKGTSDRISQFILTPADASYKANFTFSARNPRFLMSNDRLTPAVIVTPDADSQVQAVVTCARKNDMQIRTRSGGHDFEGLSYSSTYTRPFVLLDMINLRSVTVDPVKKTAIVQAGATLGEVYYYISKASGTLGFPGGVWSTVGATGLICGGGYGPLRRKYGFAADNVLDARIVNVNGRILNKRSMGEDLFWAIRGGGCASFGVILSWKLKLVDIPEKVTIFTVFREERQTEIMHPFQTVAPVLPNEVDIRCRISTVTRNGKLVVQLGFTGAYLGPSQKLLSILNSELPQLGIQSTDLNEVPWVDALMQSSFFPMFSKNYSVEDFLDRDFLKDIPTKAKSDFVRSPISVQGLDGLWKKLLEVGETETTVIFTPYGGVLDDSPESTLPFPNRAGTLYMIYTRVLWMGDTAQKLKWIRSLEEYLTPHVSSNPRRAYYNYDDLDIGSNPNVGLTSKLAVSNWGKRYFNNNFDRLSVTKTMVDPTNFFRHEQTIIPLPLVQDT